MKRAFQSKQTSERCERTDERVAQYFRLYSCLFQTTVQPQQQLQRGSRSTCYLSARRSSPREADRPAHLQPPPPAGPSHRTYVRFFFLFPQIPYFFYFIFFYRFFFLFLSLSSFFPFLRRYFALSLSSYSVGVFVYALFGFRDGGNTRGAIPPPPLPPTLSAIFRA